MIWRIFIYISIGAFVFIVYESIDKIPNPQEVNSKALIIVSSVEILINSLTAWLLMKGQGEDINIKATSFQASLS